MPPPAALERGDSTGYSTRRGWELEAGDFFVAADVDPAVRERGVIPSFSGDGLETAELAAGVGGGAEQDDFTLLASDEQHSLVGQEQGLAVAISAGSPAA